MLYLSKRIYTQRGVMDGGIEVEKGIITNLIRYEDLSDEMLNNSIDYGNQRIIPGIIELHIHGYMGWAVNSNDELQCSNLCDAILSSGVTSFLPTTHLNTKDSICVNRTWANLKRVQKHGARILGISMEGPFINPLTLHFDRHVQAVNDFDMDKLKEILDASEGELKAMTLAPEMPGAKTLIHELVQRGIRACMGHTVANFNEASEGFQHGISISQKTGNCMGKMHQRGMNAIGAALLNKNIFNEIISDGQTNSLDFMKMCYELKGSDKLCIVSDGSIMSGMKPGIYDMENDKGDHYLVSDDGTLYFEGIPDGSSLHILHGLKVWVEKLNISMEEAVKMTSYNQARFLGIDQDYGSISECKVADFVVIDDNYQVKHVFQNGKLVYQEEDPQHLENKDYSRRFIKSLEKKSGDN